jgi:hypothetical protein
MAWPVGCRLHLSPNDLQRTKRHSCGGPRRAKHRSRYPRPRPPREINRYPASCRLGATIVRGRGRKYTKYTIHRYIMICYNEVRGVRASCRSLQLTTDHWRSRTKHLTIDFEKQFPRAVSPTLESFSTAASHSIVIQQPHQRFCVADLAAVQQPHRILPGHDFVFDFFPGFARRRAGG